MISIEQKAPPGDRIAAEWNDVANATRRRRRILQSRILFYSTGKFDGTSLLNKKALRANDTHSREDEDRRERPRSARECAEAHSFLFTRTTSQSPCLRETLAAVAITRGNSRNVFLLVPIRT